MKREIGSLEGETNYSHKVPEEGTYPSVEIASESQITKTGKTITTGTGKTKTGQHTEQIPRDPITEMRGEIGSVRGTNPTDQEKTDPEIEIKGKETEGSTTWNMETSNNSEIENQMITG